MGVRLVETPSKVQKEKSKKEEAEEGRHQNDDHRKAALGKVGDREEGLHVHFEQQRQEPVVEGEQGEKGHQKGDQRGAHEGGALVSHSAQRIDEDQLNKMNR